MSEAGLSPSAGASKRPADAASEACKARLSFSESLGFELIERLPWRGKVLLKTIGDNSDQNVGSEIQRFLEDNGYSVIRLISKRISPPPEENITIQIDRYDVQVIVSPSFDCSVG